MTTVRDKARSALRAVEREMETYNADTLGDDPQEFDQWRVLYDAASALRSLLDEPITDAQVDAAFDRFNERRDETWRDAMRGALEAARNAGA